MVADNGQEMNERIKVMMDAAPMAVTFYENRTLVDCNMECVKMFGYTDKNEFIKEYTEEFYKLSAKQQPCGTPTPEKFEIVFNEAYSNGRTQFEWLHLSRYGEEIPIHVTFTRMDYQDRHVMVAYCQDLRKIKATEKREQESSELINSLLASSTIFIDIWDEDFNMIDCNDRVVDLFGISSKEEYIKNFDSFIPEYQPCGTPSTQKYQERIAQVMRDGHAQFEFMHITATGEELPVEANMFALNVTINKL